MAKKKEKVSTKLPRTIYGFMEVDGGDAFFMSYTDPNEAVNNDRMKVRAGVYKLQGVIDIKLKAIVSPGKLGNKE